MGAYTQEIKPYDAALLNAQTLNAQLTDEEKKYKRWVVRDAGNGNYEVVLEYNGITVKANRKGKGILLLTLIYILWKNL